MSSLPQNTTAAERSEAVKDGGISAFDSRHTSGECNSSKIMGDIGAAVHESGRVQTSAMSVDDHELLPKPGCSKSLVPEDLVAKFVSPPREDNAE